MSEQARELNLDDKEQLTSMLPIPGHRHPTVWLDGGHGGAFNKWLEIVQRVGVRKIDLVGPKEGPASTGLPEANTKQPGWYDDLVDEIMLDGGYGYLAPPLVEAVVRRTASLSSGIVSLGAKAVGETFGLLNRFVPRNNESAPEEASVLEKDNRLGYHADFNNIRGILIMSGLETNTAPTAGPTDLEMLQTEDAIAGLHAAGGVYGASTVDSKYAGPLSGEYSGETVRPAPDSLIDQAEKLRKGIVHLGSSTLDQTVGLIQRVTPGVNYYG